MSDDLGDRMKVYERAEAGRRFMPLLPILARVDGRAFHSFTRGLERPYSERMTTCMVLTAQALLTETNACCAYTQSDEITLAWHVTDPQSQVWFDGKIAKMVSQLGALATLHFYREAEALLGREYAERLPTFDARAWQVPNRTEGANVFLWREWDATKNSLTMAASAHYSHNELHEKNGAQKHDMLHAKGVNWNDYPASFKRGTFIQRKREMRPFNASELESLPPKHHARTNPDLAIERWQIGPVDMQPFASVTNREAVVFDGADPCFSDKPHRRNHDHAHHYQSIAQHSHMVATAGAAIGADRHRSVLDGERWKARRGMGSAEAGAMSGEQQQGKAWEGGNGK